MLFKNKDRFIFSIVATCLFVLFGSLRNTLLLVQASYNKYTFNLNKIVIEDLLTVFELVTITEKLYQNQTKSERGNTLENALKNGGLRRISFHGVLLLISYLFWDLWYFKNLFEFYFGSD